MLMRTDPFRQMDRFAELFATAARPAAMSMDAWKAGHEFIVEFDLPGVEPASIDLDVEGDVLTVRAERKPSTGSDMELVASERPHGVFSRQVILGDTLDAERINASYNAGVLRLTIPVAEKAKARKISISVGEDQQQNSISANSQNKHTALV
jgi:HSP20 family protein